MLRSIFILLSVALLIGGCTDDDSFNTRPGDRLRFSVDMVSFDTIIAGTLSVTHKMTVYNTCGHNISISDVALLDGQAGGFRANVDGVPVGGRLDEPIDLRKDDSLIVFVDCRPAESGQDDKQLHHATLQFTLANGATQQLTLEAWAQDVVWLRHEHITDHTVLSAQRPYVVSDSLTVEEGATLQVESGVRLMFMPGAFLLVKGRLVCNGTRLQPVVMRGHRMDYMFRNQPYDRIPGQWQGVVFESSSTGNMLQYCDIHSAETGISVTGSDDAAPQLCLDNCIVQNMSDIGLRASASCIEAVNCLFSNACNACVSLTGGRYSFVHCTLAQCYPFDGMRGPALLFTNEDADGTPMPLRQMAFYNSLITGYSSDEILGMPSQRNYDADFDYLFENCVVNTPPVDDEGFIDCDWDRQKDRQKRERNFRPFSHDSLIYDFHLREDASAIGVANIDIALARCPYDRDGHRRTGSATDAGCYLFVKPESAEPQE